MRLAPSVALGLVLAAVAACGSPEELSQDDGRVLTSAREQIDDAIDTEETLRTSKDEARRLVARVRKIVAKGSFETDKLDEFGIADLGLLREIVPSLVIVDADGTPEDLDRSALKAFLANATSDAPAALLPAVEKRVGVIVDKLEATDAGDDTKIPGAQADAAGFLDAVARDVRRIWPDQAERLDEAL